MEMWTAWLGVVLGAASLAWQAWTRSLDGSRVRVEILTAYASWDSSPQVVMNKQGQLDPSWSRGMVGEGRAIPTLTVRVRVRGRAAATVEGIALKLPSGQMISLARSGLIPPPLNGPEFPHRIEAGSAAAWPIDPVGLLHWFADKEHAKTAGKGDARAVAFLADGRRVASRLTVQVGGTLRRTTVREHLRPRRLLARAKQVIARERGREAEAP